MPVKKKDLRVDSYMEFVEFVPAPLRPLYCVLLALSQSMGQVYEYHKLLSAHWQLVKADVIRLKKVWKDLNGGDLGRTFYKLQLLEASRALLLLQWSVDPQTNVSGYYIDRLVEAFGGNRSEGRSPSSSCVLLVEEAEGVTGVTEETLSRFQSPAMFTVEMIECLMNASVELHQYPNRGWMVEVCAADASFQRLDAHVVDRFIDKVPKEFVLIQRHSGTRGRSAATTSCTMCITVPCNLPLEASSSVTMGEWIAPDAFLSDLKVALNAAGVPVSDIRRPIKAA
ncbi:hypothetical protein HYW18_01290 [Candidatus Uhrbacteria bacterium]|nr:hypothetical protein [Candidatus Uhrbacteria bacterium]